MSLCNLSQASMNKCTYWGEILNFLLKPTKLRETFMSLLFPRCTLDILGARLNYSSIVCNWKVIFNYICIWARNRMPMPRIKFRRQPLYFLLYVITQLSTCKLILYSRCHIFMALLANWLLFFIECHRQCPSVSNKL